MYMIYIYLLLKIQFSFLLHIYHIYIYDTLCMPGIICINFKKFCNITKYIKNINHVRIVYDYECSLYNEKIYF